MGRGVGRDTWNGTPDGQRASFEHRGLEPDFFSAYFAADRNCVEQRPAIAGPGESGAVMATSRSEIDVEQFPMK